MMQLLQDVYCIIVLVLSIYCALISGYEGQHEFNNVIMYNRTVHLAERFIVVLPVLVEGL